MLISMLIGILGVNLMYPYVNGLEFIGILCLIISSHIWNESIR